MLRLVMLIVCCGLVGCFGSSGPGFEGELEPVSGVVLVGGAAHPHIEITFLPLPGTSGTGGFARTDAQGQFELKHRSGKSGIEAGEYKVLFSLVTKPDGSPLGPEDDAATEGTEWLPARYQDLQKTPETVTIAPGGTTLNFELPAPRK